MEIYSLKDEKADTFLQPIAMQNKAEVQRRIGQMAMNPDGMMFIYPEDFTLYFLGTWDEKTAKFTQMETPVLICSVKSLQKQEFMELMKQEYATKGKKV